MPVTRNEQKKLDEAAARKQEGGDGEDAVLFTVTITVRKNRNYEIHVTPRETNIFAVIDICMKAALELFGRLYHQLHQPKQVQETGAVPPEVEKLIRGGGR